MRGVAALFVFFYHVYHIVRIYTDITHPRLEFFHIGVDIFFVISGFIMIAVLSRVKVFDAKYVVKFLKARFIRIIPQYFLVTFVIYIGYVYIFNNPRELDYKDLLTSLIFIPYKTVDGVYPVLGVGWTLNYEMLFYAVLALSILILRNCYVLGVFIIFSGLAVSGHFSLFSSTPLIFWSKPIILGFLAGMLLGIFYFKNSTFYSVRYLYLFTLCILLFVFGLYTQHMIVAILTVGVLLLLENNGAARKVFKSRVFVFLGNTSYTLYLLHQPVLSLFGKVFDKLYGFELPFFIFFSVISLAVSLGLAVILDRLISRISAEVKVRLIRQVAKE
ncbi:acyltransferase [Shewanella sp. NIFS-20-20]|nr:acyltransferase [Shewanella sp. NIFS-20-20]